MADSQRLILMIQPTRLQGLIWQAVLKSQKLSVIWEAPETDLEENLNQLKQAGLALPDLLLIDVRLRNFNPYAFCRWCRDNCPNVRVVLVNGAKKEIIPSERQWAILQGAAELLPAFDSENLVTTVADGVKRVLKALDEQSLDNGALISVLLNIKRELDARRINTDSSSNGKAIASHPDEPSGPLSKLKNNRSTTPKFVPTPPPAQPQLGASQNGYGKPPAPVDVPVEPPTVNEDDLPHDEPPPTRMYRGRKY